jgi:hypothetical protein
MRGNHRSYHLARAQRRRRLRRGADPRRRRRRCAAKVESERRSQSHLGVRQHDAREGVLRCGGGGARAGEADARRSKPKPTKNSSPGHRLGTEGGREQESGGGGGSRARARTGARIGGSGGSGPTRPTLAASETKSGEFDKNQTVEKVVTDFFC